MTIDKKRITDEAQHFFEWPAPKRRDIVTLTSCVIFAAKIAEMVRAEQRPPEPAATPLTDERIKAIYEQETGFDLDSSPVALMDFARAIEASHGIGGKHD